LKEPPRPLSVMTLQDCIGRGIEGQKEQKLSHSENLANVVEVEALRQKSREQALLH